MIDGVQVADHRRHAEIENTIRDVNGCPSHCAITSSRFVEQSSLVGFDLGAAYLE